MDFCIHIKWRKIIRFLWVMVFLMTAFSLMGQYSTYHLGDGHLHQFVPHFSWIIPAAVLILILSLIYTRFFFALPFKVRMFVLASGLLFLSGALGMEMIAGPLVEARGSANFSYALMANAEEFLELSGMVLFITALFVHLEREFEHNA